MMSKTPGREQASELLWKIRIPERITQCHEGHAPSKCLKSSSCAYYMSHLSHAIFTAFLLSIVFFVMYVFPN